MTAVAALLILLLFLIPGCQKSRNQPPPSPSPSPTESAIPTATPLPTPIPYSQRNFPCLSNTIVGKEFDYSPEGKQDLHLISAKLGEDSNLIARANHLGRFSTVEPGRSVHID